MTERNQTKSRSKVADAKSKAVVQVAVFENNPGSYPHADVLSLTSDESFFDFTRPLQILEGRGWNSSIRVWNADQEGFFVLTSNDPFR